MKALSLGWFLLVPWSAIAQDWQCPAHSDTNVGYQSLGDTGPKVPRVRYHLDVHIENGFARTTIDQVYYNPRPFNAEHICYFLLPPDAAVSRLAMTARGEWREAAMTERGHANETFNAIRWERTKDPALLQTTTGHQYQLRLFPILPNEHKRVLISYVEKLSGHDDSLDYHFLGADSQSSPSWSANIRVVRAAGMRWHSASHPLLQLPDPEDLILQWESKTHTLAEPLSLKIHPHPKTKPDFQAYPMPDGSHALVVDWQLADQKHQPQVHDWIVLFEASADRDPVMARQQIDALKILLEQHDQERITILTVNTSVREVPKPLLEHLNKLHLIGGLPLDRAFGRAAELATRRERPVILHLGGARPSLGERETEKLLAMLPKTVPYLGLGIDHQCQRRLMQAAAAQSRGLYVDYHIPQDAQDLLDRFQQRHELPLTNASDGKHSYPLFSNQKAIRSGDRVYVTAHLPKDRPLPKHFFVGNHSWQPEWQIIDRPYGFRHLAKLKMEGLLEPFPRKHREEIISLSQITNVLSPHTALLALENDMMHRQFNVPWPAESHWPQYKPDDLTNLPKPPAAPSRQGWEKKTLGTYKLFQEPAPEPMFWGFHITVKHPNLEPDNNRSSGPPLSWRPHLHGHPMRLAQRPLELPDVNQNSSQYRFLAPMGTELLSRGAKVTASDENPIIGTIDKITDGDKDAADGSYVELKPGPQWLQLDLGERCELYTLMVWHYHKARRAYDDVIIQVSDDPSFQEDVTTVLNNDHDNSSGFGVGHDQLWVESNLGRRIQMHGERARYIRLRSNGNTMNELNHYIEVEAWGRLLSGTPQDNVLERLTALEESMTSMLDEEEIDLEWLRFSHREWLAAMGEVIKNGNAPENAAERIIEVTDRWWAIDAGSHEACWEAAKLFRQLGRRDLEWAYLTTPAAVLGTRKAWWRQVAQYAEVRDDPVLAELARREAAHSSH